jgi:hypothetical protein
MSKQKPDAPAHSAAKDDWAEAEFELNGALIDWPYWSKRLEITPLQAAKLLHWIDPIKWPGDRCALGLIDDEPEIRTGIQRYAELLAERGDTWTLQTIVKSFSNEEVPYMMSVYAAKAEQEGTQAKPLTVVRASKAPPVITPLRGSGATIHVWETTTKEPTWREWIHIPGVRLWQACALSLNIEPNSMKRSSTAWMAGPGRGPFFEDKSFPSADVKAEFELRLRVLLANLSNRAFFSPGILSTDTPGNHGVALSEFAAWAVSVVKWSDLPPELVAMARMSDTKTAAPAKQSEAPPGETITHKLGNTRTHALGAVIADAKKSAVDATDYHSVWAALVKAAESKNPPPPLLGHVESEGVKYTTEKGVKFFSKDSLRKMMGRAANAR